MKAGAVILWSSLFSAVASGADLGRLFTTPGERNALDRDPTTPRHKMVTLQGVVMRQGGEPVAWINGRPMVRGDAGEGFTLMEAGHEGALIARDAPSPPDGASGLSGAEEEP